MCFTIWAVAGEIAFQPEGKIVRRMRLLASHLSNTVRYPKAMKMLDLSPQIVPSKAKATWQRRVRTNAYAISADTLFQKRICNRRRGVQHSNNLRRCFNLQLSYFPDNYRERFQENSYHGSLRRHSLCTNLQQRHSVLDVR